MSYSKNIKSMKYYTYQNNIEEGPFDDLEIEAKLREGIISSENLARRENESQWQPLSTFFPAYSGTPHSWMQNSEDAKSKESRRSYKEQPERSANEQDQSQTSNYAPPQAFEKPKPPVQGLGNQYAFYNQGEETMPLIAMIGGILCVSFMLLGLIPCFGWINWFVLFAGGINIVLSIIGIANAKDPANKNKAIIGLVLTAIAMFIGFFRLVAGAGCI